MTYYPQTFINDYYTRSPSAASNTVGIQSIPRSNVDIKNTFTVGKDFVAGDVVFSTAIRPQINIENVQYIDFYAAIEAISGAAHGGYPTMKWRIRQADIDGLNGGLQAAPAQLGGYVTNGVQLYPSGTSSEVLTAAWPTLSNGVTNIGRTSINFTNSINLFAGKTYYVDCYCESTVNITGISSTVSTSTFTKSGHGLVSGEKVMFTSIGSTAGISLNIVYYVRDVSANTFKVSATSGGTAITLSGTNSTTIALTRAPNIYMLGTNIGATDGGFLRDQSVKLVAQIVAGGTGSLLSGQEGLIYPGMRLSHFANSGATSGFGSARNGLNIASVGSNNLDFVFAETSGTNRSIGGSIASATYSSNVITYTVTNGHGLASGDVASVRGSTTEYNFEDYEVFTSTANPTSTGVIHTGGSTTQFKVYYSSTPASYGGGAKLGLSNIYAFDFSRTVNAGTGVYSLTSGWNNPNILNFIPFIRIRGASS